MPAKFQVNHIETHWPAADGIQLYAQGWEPVEQPEGIICIVHGLGEHCGRYAHLAETLCRAGYAALAFDLRGHGRSQGPRGHSPSFDTFMEDISLLVEAAARRYTGLPRFLYGHSMGGLLVLNYVLRYQPDLSGVIVTSPGLRTPLTEQKGKIAFAKAMSAILPKFRLSTGLDPQAISRDPQVVQAYQTDPLIHDQVSLRMANTTLEAIPWAMAHAVNFNVPLLLMHGTADRLTFPEGTQEFAGLVRCECTVKLWEGLYHELHNEPEKGEVLEYLVEWIKHKTENGKRKT